MKSALKRCLSFYLNTWWLPPFVLAAWFVSFTIMVYKTYSGDGSHNFMPLFISIYASLGVVFGVGVPFSWGWLSAKQQSHKVLRSFGVLMALLFLSIQYLEKFLRS